MGAVYKQLSITEQRKIERWRHAKVPVDEIARVLKRCRSTIFRELKRNHFSDRSTPGSDRSHMPLRSLKQPNGNTEPRRIKNISEHGTGSVHSAIHGAPELHFNVSSHCSVSLSRQ